MPDETLRAAFRQLQRVFADVHVHVGDQCGWSCPKNRTAREWRDRVMRGK